MTIKTTGALAMSEINAEFGLGNNLNAYRGVNWYKDDGSSGTFQSSNIDFGEFYGTRRDAPTLSVGLKYSDCSGGYIGCAAYLNVNYSGTVFAACHATTSGRTYTYDWTEYDEDDIIVEDEVSNTARVKAATPIQVGSGPHPVTVTVTEYLGGTPMKYGACTIYVTVGE